MSYSIKNIKEEFKSKGIFYTPPELSIYLRSLLPDDIKEIYDPTCGDGALLSVFDDDVIKYGQEINEDQLNVAMDRLNNFNCQLGDTLKDPGFKDKKFDYIIANPPFSIKWEPMEDERFKDAPVLPPPSRADYAFILHIIHYLSDKGKAVILGFPGILYRGQREGKIRQYLIEENLIEKVISIPGKKFEDTAIATCVLIINKAKDNTDIIFRDEELQKERIVTLNEIEENDYTLNVSTYIHDDTMKNEIDVDKLIEETNDAFLQIEKLRDKIDTTLDNMIGSYLYKTIDKIDATEVALQRICRERFKIHLLNELMLDLNVCGLMETDPLEYIGELKSLIDYFYFEKRKTKKQIKEVFNIE